jgi:predicted anti-sigma-YlaC factor YlaD
MVILVLYGIAMSEAYYLPRYGYGLEWVLGSLGLTAFVAGYWINDHWDD